MTNYGKRQDEMAEWLKSKGVIFCEGGEFRPLIVNCFAESATAFPELFDDISVLYIYDQEEQECEDGRTSDAIFWYYGAPDHVMLFAIGISTAAAAQGEEYVLLCILHELAHMKNLIDTGKSNHTSSFHYCLNNLIEKFNRLADRNIQNDYSGLQMRHDSRAWTLPDNIPTQTRKQGQEFRHG